jgi:hypothetical protein
MNFNLEDVGSTFLIKSNRFHGPTGIALEQNTGEGNQCLVLGNNVQQVSDIGVYLGPGVRGCTVVGNNHTNVLDLGTDNILVGVNNKGAGAGQSIQNVFRKMRH